MLKKIITKLMRFLKRNKLVIIISICLILAPFIKLHGLYDVGGDDTRLYYIFPREMFRNFAGNIISNNTLGVNGGYESVSFLIPILLLILGLKHIAPYVNTQLLMYGANLAGGFLFFYLFTGLWIEEDRNNTSAFLARIVSSLFYILSLFVIKTVFSSQLWAIYTISVFPAAFYFFVRSIKEDKIFFVVVSALVYSIFSSTFLTMPWFAALAFSLIPVFIILAKNYFWTFMKMSFIFIFLFAGLNLYWLFHQVYPIITRSGGSTVISSVSSSTLKQNNVDLIQSLSRLNNPINQLSAFLRSSWDERNNMDFAMSYGIMYLVTILLAGIFAGNLGKKYSGLYMLGLTGLLFSFLLVTPSFGDWNISMFIFLNNHIPLFAMFRNMYDKFGIAVSFQFAFALAVSLTILSKAIKKQTIFFVVIVLLTVATVWSARTFLFSASSETDNFEHISGQFNRDFIDMTNYIRSMHESSRFAWLPLNFASYVVIEDKNNPGHYYYGASPMQFLAGISDFTGFQSFATAADPDLNFQMLGFDHIGQYEKIGEILQRMNVKYIIISHYSIPKDAYDHLNFEGAIDDQKPEFFKLILGDKVRDFGSRYSLYVINNKFANDKIFLTNNFATFPSSLQNVQFTKTFPYQYDLEIPITNQPVHLAFLEPFDRLWELKKIDANGDESVLSNISQSMIYRYGNGWTIPANIFASGKDGANVHLRIYFKAQEYVSLANYLSLFVWVVSGLYIAVFSIKKVLRHE